MDFFIDNSLDSSLEGSSFMEISQKQTIRMVYCYAGLEYSCYFGNYLYFLFQQKEKGIVFFMIDVLKG